jgi:hypothetical protein
MMLPCAGEQESVADWHTLSPGDSTPNWLSAGAAAAALTAGLLAAAWWLLVGLLFMLMLSPAPCAFFLNQARLLL